MSESKRGLSLATLRFLGQLHGHPRRLMAQTLAVGSTAGALEAAALVLFMDSALRVVGGAGSARSIGPITWTAAPTVTLAISAGLLVTAGALHAIIARLTADGSLRVLAGARRRIVHGTLRSDWSYQANQTDGAMLTAMSHLATGASQVTMLLMSGANSAVIAAALLVAALVIAPLFAVVLIASVIPIVVVLGPAARFARRRSQEALGEVTTLYEEIAASETMALEIQAFGVQDLQLDAIDRQIDAAFRSEYRGRFSTRLAGFWFKDLALLMFILVVLVLDLVWDLSQDSAVAVLVVVIRALGYLQQSYTTTRNMIDHLPSVLDLRQRLTVVAEHSTRSGDRVLEEIAPIVFSGVTYDYPDGRPALRGADFTIGPGRTLGIVGRSGAGKSTIAELLLRLRSPTMGSIELGGVPIDHFDLEAWRRRVTFVPQEPRVWRRSIADNITFLRPGYDRSDVERAARLAHFHEDVVALPAGYDTVLGSRSRGLSGGQRQRLSIARALLSEPWLVVLDEPTSALDTHSERDLHSTLADLRGVVTMVIIAHRPSTLELCDELVIVDSGRVVAAGARDEIIGEDEFFADFDGTAFETDHA
jgi:ATP-binding cassette, subfamily B, bacterial